MQSISIFPDAAKFADLRWKNADVSRSQEVWHMIYIFFGSSLGINVLSFVRCRICVTDFRKGRFLSPIREQPQKDPSRIGLTIWDILLRYSKIVVSSFLGTEAICDFQINKLLKNFRMNLSLKCYRYTFLEDIFLNL